MNGSPAPVVVGIDGSAVALTAARWAVLEAVDRLTTVRLVCAVDDTEPTRHPTWSRERAQEALDQAVAVVADVAPSTPVETAVVRGNANEVLLCESRSAAMICIGADSRKPRPLGELATTLAGSAHCPVAIVRDTAEVDQPGGGVVAVVLNDDPDSDAVVHEAMREGRLRHSVVRQVDRRRDSWVRRFPDVRVETVAAGTGWSCDHPDRALPRLAVVGRGDAAHISDLVTPNCHPIIGYPDCSILLVRD